MVGGDRGWRFTFVDKVKSELGFRAMHRRVMEVTGTYTLREESEPYSASFFLGDLQTVKGCAPLSGGARIETASSAMAGRNDRSICTVGAHGPVRVLTILQSPNLQ